MAKKRTERNRTNPNTNTISQQRARINAGIDGRGQNSAYTGGAKSVPVYDDLGGGLKRLVHEDEANRRAWAGQSNKAVYTRTADGKLSINGKNTKGAVTNAMTPKNDDGSAVIGKDGKVRQSGRSSLANRRQRDYDNRKAMNNISPRVIEAWLRNGMARVVDGNLVGEGGNVIRQKADGNYSMGLSVG